MCIFYIPPVFTFLLHGQIRTVEQIDKKKKKKKTFSISAADLFVILREFEWLLPESAI